MKWKKALIFILSLAFMAVLAAMLWNVFKVLMTEEGRESFRSVIMDMGVLGVLVIIGLSIAQVFLFFLPGEPIELLSGMCYGAVGGLLAALVGIFISCWLIFWLVKKAGRPFVETIIGQERLEKVESSEFLKSGKAEKLLLFLFVIPGTPKDFFVYVGALMHADPLKFITLSTLFRFPSIISSTVVGASFAEGNRTFAIIVYAVTAVVSLIIMRFYSKKPDVQEMIELSKEKNDIIKR